MKLITLFTLFFSLVPELVYAAPGKAGGETGARHQVTQWQNQYNQYIEATIKTRKTGCTPENIIYRREWGSMSKKSRKEYISAVQCLMNKPPIYPTSEVPGARSHFDDFSALHIQQATSVHFDGLFLPFHRYYLWLYEQALRNECGYTGTQPYWDWTLDWENPDSMTVFDGSPHSMGSNGRRIPHGIVNVTAFGLTVPVNPGTGGGCVHKGPFKDHTLNLGPVALANPASDGGLGYNPRCLVRDLHPEWSQLTRPSEIVRVFEKCNDLECFGNDAEGPVGFHTAGHFIIGGIAMDPWASPQDPMFWLHHAMVDRMWSVWQGLKPGERVRQVYGTQTAFNNPPSANVTLESEMDYGRLGPKQKVGDIVSTVDGPLCYAYI